MTSKFEKSDASTRRAELLVLMCEIYTSLRDQSLSESETKAFALFKDIMDLADVRTVDAVFSEIEHELDPKVEGLLNYVHRTFMLHDTLCKAEAEAAAKLKAEEAREHVRKHTYKPPVEKLISKEQITELCAGLTAYVEREDVRPKVNVDLIDDILESLDKNYTFIDTLDLSNHLEGEDLKTAVKLIEDAVTESHQPLKEVMDTIWCHMAKRDLPAVDFFDQYGNAEDENYALAP
ncbi:hypothetical protein pEaSNUABM14_00290 [Erwinia phage pEa_SNUABM_14]|uniref:Uncharacterized protein n=1 Tax=Erwinia phage pEa_SNUABM_7 TaxID=2866695 RepID=A0AAE8BLZ7_9CAUD|nr:hypothetical protein MPK74_gp293 [Erwinia phage pEa_SNUABM_7]QYW04615.1 hypothetical protein pEaSNUABM14_00290 [Erwinia phage pEa_SNUABM_14]QYW04961.1 hypothetical protein pEaSNUABM7_00293 [Erwinia phage pEa_SNUABM_7]QYW05303.1 hypothetical protein pEaSNUABM21_00289 [Erwinia phage pEa_SNUABM_21]